MHRLCEDIGPERTIVGEYFRHGQDVFQGRVRLVDSLAKQNFAVGHRLYTHCASDALAGWQTQSPAPLQVALRQRRRIGSYRRRKIAQWINQGRVQPIGELQTLLVFFFGAVVSAGINVDKPPPINSPLWIHRAKSGQTFGQVLLRNWEDWQQNRVVQSVAWPNHRVAEPVGRNRELDRHEWQVLPMEVLELVAVVFAVIFQLIKDAGVGNSWQEVIEDDILIVESNQLLNLPE